MIAGPEKLHGAAMADDDVAALHARIAQLEGAIRLAADKSRQLESMAAKATEMLHEIRADVRRLRAIEAAARALYDEEQTTGHTRSDTLWALFDLVSE